jgi:hypothetical protein
MAAYLGKMQQIVKNATISRAAWIRQVGSLMLQAHADPGSAKIAEETVSVGNDQRAFFADFRRELARLDPPPMCEECHLLAGSWLEKHMAACDIMIDSGRTGELEALRMAQGLLADGRSDARHLAAEYAGLVSWLRAQLANRKSRKKPAGAHPRQAKHPLGGA